MIDKTVRLVKAFAKESAKRLPYILAIFLLIIVLQGYNNGRITKGNSTDTKTLLNRVASLGEDNKKLTQQNIDLQRQTNNQLACLSNLFIDFINSGRAVTKADADSCSVSSALTEQATSSSEAATPQRASSNRASGASPSPSSQPAPAASPAQSTPSPIPAQPANNGLFDRLIFNPVTNVLKGVLGVQ